MPPDILLPTSPFPLPSPAVSLRRSTFCLHCLYTSYTSCLFPLEDRFVSEILKDSYFFPNFSPHAHTPELRKGNVSSLSLSPSGPGAVVPRSNRDAPLPESGKRGNRDCMA